MRLWAGVCRQMHNFSLFDLQEKKLFFYQKIFIVKNSPRAYVNFSLSVSDFMAAQANREEIHRFAHVHGRTFFTCQITRL